MMNEKGYNNTEMIDLASLMAEEEANSNEAPILDNVINLNFAESTKGVAVDIEAFQKGISSVSELCGAITALVNVGINPHKAMDYLVDKEASKEIFAHNIEIAKIQSDSTISTLKSEVTNIQKNIM